MRVPTSVKDPLTVLVTPAVPGNKISILLFVVLRRGSVIPANKPVAPIIRIGSPVGISAVCVVPIVGHGLTVPEPELITQPAGEDVMVEGKVNLKVVCVRAEGVKSCPEIKMPSPGVSGAAVIAFRVVWISPDEGSVVIWMLT